jgi:hypothetical protein
MKKFNLQKEIIVVEHEALLTALHSDRFFGITIEGNIEYEPFNSDSIYIFQGKSTQQDAKSKTLSLSELLGNQYRIVEDDERVLIKAHFAWQQILALNISHADYDDSTADGIGNFSDAYLEEIGWHATEFDISYREMAEYLEATCEGVLLCVEIDEPYQFSGLGFITNRTCAHQQLYAFCQKRALKKMQNDPDFSSDLLTDDEHDAATFFALL